MRNAIIILLILTACFVEAGSRKQSMRKYSVFALAGGGTQGWADPNTYTALWEMQDTNTTDSSGNGYTALPTNAPVWSIIGTNVYNRIEYGFTYNGTNHYHYAPDTNAFNLTTNSTVGCWVKSTDAQASLMSRFFPTGSFDGWEINIGYSTTPSSIHFWDGTAFRFGYSYTPSNWTHIAVVVTGTSGTLYVNGAQVDTDTISNTLSGSGRMYIGRDANTTVARYFSGLLDGCFVINNYAMTSNQVYTAYINTHPTNNIRIRP